MSNFFDMLIRTYSTISKEIDDNKLGSLLSEYYQTIFY